MKVLVRSIQIIFKMKLSVKNLKGEVFQVEVEAADNVTLWSLRSKH